jgi:Flp pilus assembly protein TadG
MRSERGTTLVEFSFIFMLMMMLAIGSFEWGMGFRDRLAVAQSVREGARVGAALGDHSLSDCAILEAGAGALSSIGGQSVKEIWIYESDDTGTVGSNKQRYRPSVSGDSAAFLACDDGWYKIESNWVPSARDNVGPVRDWIGVRVTLDHSWRTNFLWWNGTVEWQESSVFHLEPKVIS